MEMVARKLFSAIFVSRNMWRGRLYETMGGSGPVADIGGRGGGG